MIVAEVNMHIAHQSEGESEQDYFIEYFSVASFDATYKTILMNYYAFTSLSTVGFGDLHPRSKVERIFCSFMLMFGVAIFSYIMGIFIEVLEKSKASAAPLDDLEMLSKFFGLMKHFNKGKPLNDTFKI